MGKSWDDSAGEAVKTKLDYIKFEMGVNKMRMVGDILPRYAYWKRLKDNNIPVECLAFDRDEEAFLNQEMDWFKHYFPKKDDGKNMTCSWSYVIRVFDPKDGKLKLCGLKKKLFEQIQDMAKKHLGDPTNPDTGWEVVFTKRSTGPLPFNVEYTLDQLDCKVQPLTDEQKEIVAEMPSIDEVLPRQTPEQQKAFIETAWLNASENESNVDDDAAKAAADGFDEDIPF
jgi:hypothetical protein